MSLVFRFTLASLTMLFGATLLAYLLVRRGHAAWRAPELPTLWPGLVAATLLLGVVSVAVELARREVATNRGTAAARTILAAGLAATAFLAVQAVNWSILAAATARIEVRTLYPFTFYLVTGVHAAHVLAGIGLLGLVGWRLHERRYSSARYEPVTLTGQYWHYLGVVWLVLFTALWWGSG